MSAKYTDQSSRLTEFAPLSPDVKNSSGFFKKFFKKSSDNSQSRSPAKELQVTAEEENEEWTEVSSVKSYSDDVHPETEYDPPASPGPPLHPRRTLSNVLGRLSNILDSKGQNPDGAKDSEIFKQYWMPDRHCKECYDCGSKFTTFRRRHHCRICGQIFCSRCCNQEVPGHFMGYQGGLRVCTYCCKVVLRYAQNPVSIQTFGDDLRKQQSPAVNPDPESTTTLSPPGDGSNYSTLQRRIHREQRLSTIFDEENLVVNRSLPEPSPPETTNQSALANLMSLEAFKQERKVLLKDSKQLREVRQNLLCPHDGLELRSHRHRLRTYHSCLVGNEIVDWLIAKDFAGSREQAVVIGQALIDGDLLECVSSHHQTFDDQYALYKPKAMSNAESPTLQVLEQNLSDSDDSEDLTAPLWFQRIGSNQHNSELEVSQRDELNKIPSTVSVPENLDVSTKSVFYVETPSPSPGGKPKLPRTLSATSVNEKLILEQVQQVTRHSTASDTNVLTSESLNSPTDNGNQPSSGTWEGTSQVGNRPTDFGSNQVSSVVLSNISEGGVMDSSGEWKKDDSIQENSSDIVVFEALKSGHMDHMKALVVQLLRKESLSQKWAGTILSIARKIVTQVQPDVRQEGDDMDIRQYVYIKKVPGSNRGQTAIISGVVCTQNVAHKRMAKKIVNPKILLLRGPVEYQRVENKFSSLEPQILQEHDFLKNCVARIAELEPDILLVEKTVSRLAQEFILDAGITLVMNVKPSVMNRVSRFVQAEIYTSVDGFVNKKTLGFCHSFKTQSYSLPDGSQKTLLYFDGCASHLGCTVILRGAGPRELAKVKSILSFLTYVAYHSKLEVAFLMDEFAMPPNVNYTPTPQEERLIFQQITKMTDRDRAEKTSSGTVKTEAENKSGNPKSTTESNNPNAQNIPLSKVKPNLQTQSASTEVLDQSDPLQNYQISQDESIFQLEDNQVLTDVRNMGDKFRACLDHTTLSISPYIKYNIPYLETKHGSGCKLRQYFPNDLFYSKEFESSNEKKPTGVLDDPVDDKNNRGHQTATHKFMNAKLTTSATDPLTQGLVSDFRARGGHIIFGGSFPQRSDESAAEQESQVPFSWNSNVDCLDPVNHQRLAVLFSSFSYESANAPNPCVSPWVVTMDFYGRNDITLGGFLERYCFRESYRCPSKSCETPMVDHIRRFVHEESCIQVVLKKLDCPMPAYQNNILAWEWCRKCKEVTPVVPMSLESWSMSFAKYLELRFHAKAYGKRSHLMNCAHNLHHDHFQYFGYRDIVASFKYMPVKLKEVSLPPMTIDVDRMEMMVQGWQSQFSSFAYKGPVIFSTIMDHLVRIGADAQPDLEMMINEHMKQVKIEKDALRVMLDEVEATLKNVEDLEESECQKSSESEWNSLVCSVTDQLVRTEKVIADTVNRWNAKIVEVEQQQKKQEKERSRSVSIMRRDTGLSLLESAAEAITPKRPPKPEDEVDSEPTFLVSEPPPESGSTSSSCAPKDTPDSTAMLEVIPVGLDMADSPTHFGTGGVDVQKKSVKTLISNFLSGPGTIALQMPFPPDEHPVLNHATPSCEQVPIIIYDQEPSSIIAYALSSSEYQVKLQEVRAQQKLDDAASSSPQLRKKNVPVSSVDDNGEDHVDRNPRKSGVLSFFRAPTQESSTGNTDTGQSSKFDIEAVRYTPKQDMEESLDTDISSMTSMDYTDQTSSINKTNKQQNNTEHIELQFSDSSANFYCKVYFAEQFRNLRKLVFPAGEERYIRSLSRCFTWLAAGGKSGSSFCKTQDDRFILKQMSKYEVQSFSEFAPSYIKYVMKAQAENRPTVLAKILGVYRVGFKNSQTISENKQDILVMENLFYQRKINQIFDLKGSLRNRLVTTLGKRVEDLVLLDENLLKSSVDCPLYIRSHSKTILTLAITNDTDFLANKLVMDYSLLVGTDEESKELVVGIIDYIRTFTWDKKLEMVVKSSYSQLGRQRRAPTVVYPKSYRSRFLQAMARYFLPVPDRWVGLGRDIDC